MDSSSDSCLSAFSFVETAVGVVVEIDFDLPLALSDGVGADAAGGRAAENFAGFEPEFGEVPGAGDASVFDGAECQRCIGVRASVFDCVDLAVVSNQGNAVMIEFNGAAFAFLQVGSVRQ